MDVWVARPDIMAPTTPPATFPGTSVAADPDALLCSIGWLAAAAATTWAFWPPALKTVLSTDKEELAENWVVDACVSGVVAAKASAPTTSGKVLMLDLPVAAAD